MLGQQRLRATGRRTHLHPLDKEPFEVPEITDAIAAEGDPAGSCESDGGRLHG